LFALGLTCGPNDKRPATPAGWPDEVTAESTTGRRGRLVSDKQLALVNLERDKFHGE
jgi:hypothetical protein